MSQENITMNHIRVTEVMAPWNDFSSIPSRVLEHAAKRGTEVHDMCSRYAKGELVFVPHANECSGYFDSFCLWFDSMVNEVIAIEERLYDDTFFFTGQLDLIVRLRTGETVLVDLKTPVQNRKSWAAQLAAYRSLAIRKYSGIDRIGSLRLSAEGGTPKMTWYAHEETHYAMFLNALQCRRYFESKTIEEV